MRLPCPVFQERVGGQMFQNSLLVRNLKAYHP